MSEYRRRLAALAEKYGRRLEITRGSHYKLAAPGKPVVFASYSTSDPVRAQERRSATQEIGWKGKVMTMYRVSWRGVARRTFAEVERPADCLYRCGRATARS
jgi:hypothetical protein